MSLSKINPIKIIEDHYNSPDAVAKRKERIRHKYEEKIQALKDGSKARIKGILNGHFRGPGSEDVHKIMFFIFLVITAVLGPLGLGFLSLTSGTGPIVMTGVFLVVLLLLERIGLINFKNFTGVVIFLFFNSILTYLMQADFLASLIGANSEAVFKGVLFVFMLVFTLHFGGVMSGRTVGVIAVLMLLLLLVPFIIGTLQNKDKLEAQQDQLQAEAEIAYKKMNLIDRIVAWAQGQVSGSSGEDINTATQQKTAEYLGVKIASAESYVDSYVEGQPVLVNVFFDGYVSKPTRVVTQCMAGNYKATASPESFDMNAPIGVGDAKMLANNQRVVCDFGKLPKGSYVVDILSYYPYESSVDFPIRIIDPFVLYNNPRIEIPEPSVENSAGPLMIHPATTKLSGEWLFYDPYAIEKDKVDSKPLNIYFEARKSETDTNGEIQNIKKITFHTPEGLKLRCLGIKNNEFLEKRDEAGKWVYEAGHVDFDYELSDVISCELFIENKEEYLNKFFLDNIHSTQTMTITMAYDYQQTYIANEPIQVKG